MHSEMSVDIRGDIDRVWDYAAATDRWPRFLPHYRYVTVVQSQQGTTRRIVEMAAWRGRIPIRWLSVVETVPDERRIVFEHIGGAARGMLVEWRIVQHDGFVRATIFHELSTSLYAIVRSRLGEYVLGRHFIEPVAGRTLGCIKELVEAEAEGGTRRPSEGPRRMEAGQIGARAASDRDA